MLLLQPPRDHITIEPVSAQAACLALTRNSFQLDLGDHANVERLFAQAAQASRSVPMMALAYPRDYARLADVISDIAQAVDSLLPEG